MYLVRLALSLSLTLPSTSYRCICDASWSVCYLSTMDERWQSIGRWWVEGMQPLMGIMMVGQQVRNVTTAAMNITWAVSHHNVNSGRRRKRTVVAV